MTSPLIELQKLGQSPWHDNIRRDLITSGALKKMVRQGDITGLTSNPTIFEQAIASSSDYDSALEQLAARGKNAEEIFDALAIDDIRHAADIFLPVYRRAGGADGHVSIEVAPKYANNTKSTIQEAHRLWKAVRRPNLMIKIPATPEGLPAIERCIADGINVNVTLIFSLERYNEVMNAYLHGLKRRVAAGKPVKGIASVASFFVSRVDSLADKLLDAKAAGLDPQRSADVSALKGLAAIANARLAYARFRAKFSAKAFQELARKGARLQRPLWASTSTKNPAYQDVYYVEALAGPDTVNTMPPATLVAYKDHGKPANRLDGNPAEEAAVLDRLEAAGIRMDEITAKLEADGVAAFAKSYDSLIKVVEARRLAFLFARKQSFSPGKSLKTVQEAVARLDSSRFGERLAKLDSTLWKAEDPAQQSEIKQRLGWIPVIDAMLTQVEAMKAFAVQARKAGFTHALVCGMGGSSLAPEVLRETFGVAKGYLDLAVLDSTDPAAVRAAERRSNPLRTLYIIASKSGGTTEPNAFFAYFWKRLTELKGSRAGENFIAITDPGTAMEKLARENRFREVFLNPANIGGRFSALSYFGLIPAALIGMDPGRILQQAGAMLAACSSVMSTSRNPGLYLGAILGSQAALGRDKVTLLAAPRVASFGCWLEQLLAESTGKEGRGIIPIEGEPPLAAAAYGRDRLFVALNFGTAKSNPAAALAKAGFPVITYRIGDAYDLGAEFLRWEIATAAAGHLMEINPYDQPNVQESKINTVRLLAEYQEKGALAPAAEALHPAMADFFSRLREHIGRARKGDYVALNAYLERTPARLKLFAKLRRLIAERHGVATMLGFGPRLLHSTGQLHKGGPDTGVFVQFSCPDRADLPVPGQAYSFGTLKTAQAIGDFEALASRKRRIVRVDLGADPEAELARLPIGLAAAAGKKPAAAAPGKDSQSGRKTARRPAKRLSRGKR